VFVKKTSILILCALGLVACQSNRSKEQVHAETTVTQSAEVSVQDSKPVQAAASAVAVATPVVVPETEKVVPVATEAPAPVAVVAKPKGPPVLSEAEAVSLAKKRGCYGCHTVHAKVYGPAWVDVAAKYRGDAGAQARLFDKVSKGGNGVWGKEAMPAQTQATEAERTQLIRFILNLK
jgi:cytochrome c